MGLEFNMAKNEGVESLKQLGDSQKAAYREMRDVISGDKLNYLDIKMQGTLNAWSNMDPTAKESGRLRSSFAGSLASLFEIAFEELRKEAGSVEDKASKKAALMKRAQDFAKIAKKHGFDIEASAQ